MGTKEVTNRDKSMRIVAAAGDESVERVRDAMCGDYGQEAARGVEVAQRAVVARLRQTGAAMLAADDAHRDEQADDAEPRDERDAVAEEARGRLMTLRDAAQLGFGDKTVAALGFKGETPADPAAVLRLGNDVLRALAKMKKGPTRIPDYVFDPAAHSEPLAPLLKRLDKALGNVAAEAKQLDATFVAKQKAIGEFDRVFSRSANLISALLAAAGEDELARRVRPTGRHPGVLPEVEETEPTTTPQ